MLVNQPQNMANKALPDYLLTANLIEEQIMKIAFEIENDAPRTFYDQMIEEEKK